VSRLDSVIFSIVRSPLHGILGRWTVVLEYVGPVSGRQIALVVFALPDGEDWLVAVGKHESKRWYKAFLPVTNPTAAALCVGSARYEVTGHLLSGEERDTALEKYRANVPGASRGTGPDTPVVRFTRRAK
jgi:hypothetical protein